MIPGRTGVLFYEQTWESLLDAILHFEEKDWDPEEIRDWALRYDIEEFSKRVKKYVDDRYEEFEQGMNQCALDISYTENIKQKVI